MQPTSIMPGLSFRQTPREGQLEVFKALIETDSLNVKLPTGYGKTYVACGAYSIKKAQGKVNRVLFIFPTDAQLEQFKKDGRVDMRYACVDGPLKVIDCRFYGTEALKKSLKNKAQIFATTIQSMINKTGMDIVGELLSKGRWMVVVDEYHHYGADKAWGRSVLALNHECFLAMSATPTRPNGDSAFGDPDVKVTYRRASLEKAVKPLVGHSYIYRVDAILVDGEVHSFTTDELAEEVGSDSPEAIERFLITRQMRWSPKYASPLVSIPIERMLTERLQTGHKLQALVGALCVSHAEIICTQIRAIFPHLEVDWVGTGEHGRSVAENRAVISRFCPPKDNDTGRRPAPELDVLVHVGMAGEGLDSTTVSEIIHLNQAGVNNTNDQENGRASRYLDGVVGHINFDSSSGYAQAGYVGDAIMDAMDGNEPQPPDPDNDPPDPKKPSDDLPEEPAIQIFDMELEGINSGDIGVQRMAKVMNKLGADLDFVAMEADPDHGDWNNVIGMYKTMQSKEAREFDEESQIAQWREAVNNAMSKVTGVVVRKMTDGRFDKSLIGDVKKRINTRKARCIGPVSNDIDVCKTHYHWVRGLLAQIKETKEVPPWLM